MPATFEVTGTAMHAPYEQTGTSKATGKEWRKMTLTIESIETWGKGGKGGSKANYVEVTAFGDFGCDKLSQINKGDEITVTGTIGGTMKKDNSGAWVNLNVQDVRVSQPAAPKVASAYGKTANQAPVDDEDLPF